MNSEYKREGSQKKKVICILASLAILVLLGWRIYFRWSGAVVVDSCPKMLNQLGYLVG